MVMAHRANSAWPATSLCPALRAPGIQAVPPAPAAPAAGASKARRCRPPPAAAEPARARRSPPESLAELLDFAQEAFSAAPPSPEAGSGSAAAAAALAAVAGGLHTVGAPSTVADPRLEAWLEGAAAALERRELAAGPAAGALWACAVAGLSPPAAALDAAVDLAAGLELGPLRGDAEAVPLARLSWALEALGRPAAADALRARLAWPWRVVPACLPDLDMGAVLGEVALRRDTITLGDGRSVPEARATAWQSDAGLPFLYSGKEMRGGALTPVLAAVRDRLEAVLGVRYDSLLVNYYPDGKSGMRYHSDPLYGVWDPDTAVVSLGATREFTFRTAVQHDGGPAGQAADSGEAAAGAGAGQRLRRGRRREEPAHFPYLVRHGDVVRMFGDCQERYQHCIQVERRAEDAAPRMSLVYKKAIGD